MTDNKVKLKDIFIGKIDGETESQRDDFLDLFYTANSKYEECLIDDKFIISGKKGTGKTILSKYIERQLNLSEDNFCKICSLKDFKLQKLINLDNRNPSPDELSFLWKWVILIKFSEFILQNHSIKRKIPFTCFNNLNKFYKKKYNDNIFKVVDVTTLKSIKDTKNASLKFIEKDKAECAAGISNEKQSQLTTHFKPKEYYELLDTVEKLVNKCLKESKKITLIFDDLDELEGKVGDDTFYINLMISMLQTMKSINLLFQSNEINCKVIVLMRPDILDILHSHSSNLNKITADSEVELYWLPKNYDSPSEHPLMDLILTKIQRSTKGYSSLDKAELYDLLFGNKIEHKNVIDYLLDYSFGRPRDLIQYLNIIKQEYKNSTSFTPQHFKACLLKYSMWFYKELINEISIHENSEFIEESLSLIANFKNKFFNYASLEEFYNKNKDFYPHISSLTDAINCMYKFGVIGNSWKVGVKNGRSVYHSSWGYRQDAPSLPDYSKEFSVHFALRKKFSI